VRLAPGFFPLALLGRPLAISKSDGSSWHHAPPPSAGLPHQPVELWHQPRARTPLRRTPRSPRHRDHHPRPRHADEHHRRRCRGRSGIGRTGSPGLGRQHRRHQGPRLRRRASRRFLRPDRARPRERRGAPAGAVRTTPLGTCRRGHSGRSRACGSGRKAARCLSISDAGFGVGPAIAHGLPTALRLDPDRKPVRCRGQHHRRSTACPVRRLRRGGA